MLGQEHYLFLVNLCLPNTRHGYYSKLVLYKYWKEITSQQMSKQVSQWIIQYNELRFKIRPLCPWGSLCGKVSCYKSCWLMMLPQQWLRVILLILLTRVIRSSYRGTKREQVSLVLKVVRCTNKKTEIQKYSDTRPSVNIEFLCFSSDWLHKLAIQIKSSYILRAL